MRESVEQFVISAVLTLASIVLYNISPMLLVPCFAIGFSAGAVYRSDWYWEDIIPSLMGTMTICWIALAVRGLF